MHHARQKLNSVAPGPVPARQQHLTASPKLDRCGPHAARADELGPGDYKSVSVGDVKISDVLTNQVQQQFDLGSKPQTSS